MNVGGGNLTIISVLEFKMFFLHSEFTQDIQFAQFYRHQGKFYYMSSYQITKTIIQLQIKITCKQLGDFLENLTCLQLPLLQEPIKMTKLQAPALESHHFCWDYFFVMCLQTAPLEWLHTQELTQFKHNQYVLHITQRLGFNDVKAQNIFFGVRVGYLMPQISIKYFDIGFNIIYEDGTNLTYQMQICSPQQWKKLGDNYEQQYSKFNLDQFYCTRPDDIINIKKIFYAPNSQYATIFVRPCLTNTSQLCQSPANQQQFIETLNSIEGAIFVQMYFLDQAINPNQKQPIQYFTNTDVQFAFTTKRGIIGTIQFASYRVQTDMSVFPVQQISVNQGTYLNTFRQTSLQIKDIQDNFATIYISLNRKFTLIQRRVGKLDDMLSYAGGLFSIIIGFLSIFFLSFNKYRYELMVAEGIFNEDEDGNAIREHQFTFWLYIKYTVFDWILTLFCFQMNWQDCQIIEATRDQANKQIDVTKLFRKIQSLQTTVNHIIGNRGQKQCLALLKPQKLTGIIRNRMILQYYNRIIQGKTSITFQQYRLSYQILKFGLSLLKNEQLAIHEVDNGSKSNRVHNVNHTTNQEILKQQIQINYQLLVNKQYLQQIIQQKFQYIVVQANQIKLAQDQKQIENDLSQSFFSLNQQLRASLLSQIPIKLLYRLAKAYCPHNDTSSQYQSKGSVFLDVDRVENNKKKVVLNIFNPMKKQQNNLQQFT